MCSEQFGTLLLFQCAPGLVIMDIIIIIIVLPKRSEFTGSLVMLKKYKQFAGSVFVKKAVSDHMVLTFCSPNEQLYSVVVARDKSLDAKELKSIKNHMQVLKLPITQTTRTCRNASSVIRAGRLLPWIIVAATLGFARFLRLSAE